MHIFHSFFPLLLIISANVYLFIRGWQVLSINSIIRIIYAGLFLLFSVSLFLGYFYSEIFPERLGNTIKLIGGYWIVFFTFLLLSALLADFLRILNYFFGIFPASVTSNFSQVKLIYFTIVMLSLIMLSLYGFRKYANPEIKNLVLSVNKENDSFKDLSIIAISDIHLGNIVGTERLAEWIKLINSQNPDIVLVAGDLFDRNFNFAESKPVEALFMTLKSKYGVYAVLGNHEYTAGLSQSIESLKRCGITLLRDQAVIIDNRFVIAGRDDATNRKRKTVGSILTGLDNRLPVILMDHQPYLKESVLNNIDLQISGHTHNGQIFPFNLRASLVWELAYGYQKIKDTHFYVSSGLGLRIVPLRLGTQSEIVRILLKPKTVK